jgi:all-trans-retinol dehydrogenase (NAD+)
VNTLAHVWLVKSVLPAMMAANHGHIVTIASASALIGVAKLADYASSKWAAYGFAESLRMELHRLGKTGVKTTIVCPFYINTGMFEGVQSRWSFLLPLLDPNYVASQIVAAMRENREVLSMPAIVGFVPLMRALLPVPAFDAIAALLGINNSMDHFVGRVLGPPAHGVRSPAPAAGAGAGAGAAVAAAGSATKPAAAARSE